MTDEFTEQDTRTERFVFWALVAMAAAAALMIIPTGVAVYESHERLECYKRSMERPAGAVASCEAPSRLERCIRRVLLID